MDAVAFVNNGCGIVHADASMKNLLEIKPRDLSAQRKFCDFFKLSVGDDKCQIEEAMRTGEILRFDECAAFKREKQKLRVSIKIVPFFKPGEDNEKGTLQGAIITLRDTSAELLTQAKYHKLVELNEKKDLAISALDAKIKALRQRMSRTLGKTNG